MVSCDHYRSSRTVCLSTFAIRHPFLMSLNDSYVAVTLTSLHRRISSKYYLLFTLSMKTSIHTLKPEKRLSVL